MANLRKLAERVRTAPQLAGSRGRRRAPSRDATHQEKGAAAGAGHVSMT